MTGTILTNLRGRRFGNLVAVKMLPRAASRSTAYWKCRCSCGGLAVVSAVQLLHGARKILCPQIRGYITEEATRCNVNEYAANA